MVLAMDGEIQQIVKESGAGYIVNTEDSIALADAVIKLYSNSKEEREAMGASAKRYYFEHFERDKNMEKLIEFLEIE
jgi:glycosyltransferase involved in cell wall biosynthesis